MHSLLRDVYVRDSVTLSLGRVTGHLDHGAAVKLGLGNDLDLWNIGAKLISYQFLCTNAKERTESSNSQALQRLCDFRPRC